MKNTNFGKMLMANPMFQTYFSSKASMNKNEFLNKINNGLNKKLTHKNSMDNILERRGNTFITLKHLLEKQKTDESQRKIRSSVLIKEK
jgi:hypothetical protein